MRIVLLVACGICTMLAASPAAFAEADGPDYWNVIGIRAGSALHMRASPSERSTIVARVPPDAVGLRNLGCRPQANLADWETLSRARKAIHARGRWCQVDFNGARGWVAGRYLTEGNAVRGVPAAGAETIGPWTVTCRQGECTLEQSVVDSGRTTRFRIEPRPNDNARIEISKPDLPADGVLTISMDGEIIMAGPLAPLRAGSSDRLVMTPDDMTAGFLRQMSRRKTMELQFAGDGKAVALDITGFPDAMRRARAAEKGGAR